MTTRKTIGKRITSMFLIFAMIATMLPLLTPTAVSGSVHTDRVADLSTMHSWKDYFSLDGELSTENAGSVWVDKSVFTDASAFAGTGITQDKSDSFLVALSTIAANMSITGISHVPTDTMLVLDVSGSMSDNYSDVAEELVDAANESIATLLATNKHNRVGVVLYSGSTTGDNYNGAAKTILPLDRYTTGSHGRYLQYSITGSYSTTETISVNKDVRIQSTKKAPPSVSKNVVGSTYIQRGIITAMNQFIAKNNDIIVEDPILGTLHRKPVLVLMSDGSPTLGSVDFTDPGYDSYYEYELGDGLDTSAAIGFVSQLTAAYAKAKIEEKYDAKPLFYTLGLGVSGEPIATGVLDPTNKDASPALKEFWDKYNKEGATSVKVSSYYSVEVIDTVLEQNYVNQYFAADGSSGNLSAELSKAFRDIIGTILLQSVYFPTQVDENKSLSGYISFVDKIGTYMEVTDIKGILIDNQLFSGADLAANFVSGGGALGTYSSPTELGIEMVKAVQLRLGLDSEDTARALIGLAYEHGQLSYTDKNNYSNYIGWYANKAGQFLGFYHEGVTVLPAPTGNEQTDPAFTIKSYGYLGSVDKDYGVTESDMMYATVQVREDITTGNQLVTFAVPAALIPVVTYRVDLDGSDNLENISISGANAPIRLVYEVALDESINSFNVKDILSDEYLADPHHLNEDGSVNFYVSQWEHENTTGYGTVNTYSYFNPSRMNDRYYYLEDAPIYVDNRGTLYTGDTQPSADDTVYRRYNVYRKDDKLHTDVIYREFSDEAKATAIRNSDGTWYVPEGNVRVNLDGYTVSKYRNPTRTLSNVNVPFVDTHNHKVNDWGYHFYVGATLGNNGKLTVIPKTGIRLTKTMAEGVIAPNTPFTFYITNETNTIDDTSYPAWILDTDGKEHYTTVAFTRGKATVALKAGQILVIGDMTPGDTFHIEEQETLDYVATANGLSENGTVTVVEDVLSYVSFVNDARGSGSLTITKQVEHDLGNDYQIPADKVFTMEVTLTGFGTANTAFSTTNGYITTDASGRFSVTLRHNEAFTVYNLPGGTVATVVEQNVPTGFTPTYWENGTVGDGAVTVAKNTAVAVLISNNYQPAPVAPNVTVSGEKFLNGRDWTGNDSFSFLLEKRLEDGSWQVLGEPAIVSKGSTILDLTEALATELYTSTGIYSYRVTEIQPDAPLGGIDYDKTVHSFSIHVGDRDMDGKLEIQEVTSDTSTVTSTQNSWNVTTNFTNTYSTAGNVTVTIDVTKHIVNLGGADKSLAGFTFGLFDASGKQVFESVTTTEQGFARFELPYSAAELGNGNHSFTYTLKEIAPDPIPAGWSYSTETVTVHVDVTDNGDGTISAVIYTEDTKPENAGTLISTSFTNTYNPADTQLTVDFVRKELIGKKLGDKDFTFEVQLPDGTTLLKGSNNAAGKVTFDGTLAFDKVGTYRYIVVETSQDGNGIVTDKIVYNFTVTVTDKDGKLNATYALVGTNGDTITFRNTYTAGSVDHVIRGGKTLNGRPLLNDEFTFILKEVVEDGPSSRWTVKNFANGEFIFPTITYTAAGTYVYTVEEEIPNGGKAYGVTYDKTRYTVTVVIADDGKGNLYVESETITDADSLHFVNTYAPDPTDTQFIGDKLLTGKVSNALKGGEFSFTLYNSDANWTLGNVRETVRNGANGTIIFQKIDFDTVTDQYFIVTEKDGGKTIDGITYDDTVYRIWVEVTDDLLGQLHATVHIYDGDGIPQDSIRFVNTYEVTGGATVILSGEKHLEGRDFLASDSFTFRLYDGEGSYITAAMDAKTHRYQFKLNYTSADIGRTFHYLLEETNAGKTIDGITYSKAQYRIQVEVLDDNKGGIQTIVTVDNATTATMDFTNRYEAAPTSIVISGNKELSGKDLTDGAFTFLMFETDETFAVPKGVNPTMVQNGSNGSFTFDRLDFDTAGDRYYIVFEQDGGQTIDGITYDDTLYRIRVEVTDDLKGQLHATAHIFNGEGISQDSITFLNAYEVTGDATVTLSGEKHLEGRDFLPSDNFTFRLYDAAGDYISAAMDAKTHRYQFTLNYTPADVGRIFHYTLKETYAGETINGITYSDVAYQIKVVVEDDTKGGIRTTVTVDNATTSNMDFTNRYHADATSIIISGNKELTGMNLTDGAFTFLMYETDETFAVTKGVAPMVAQNGADGKFSFGKLDFTTDKDRYFIVVEQDGGQTIDGITYDNTLYRVWIEATDDLKGQLHATAHISNGQGSAQNGIVFLNAYNITGEATVTLSGEKHLEGRDFLDDDSFIFHLYSEDGSYITAAMDPDTHRYQFTLNYSAADVGKTFLYTLKEANAGQTINGVTYSDTAYQIQVVVEDDTKGGIRTIVTVDNGTTSTLDFTNRYSPATGYLTISGNKVLSGRDLLDGEFIFLMAQADETFTVAEGTIPVSALNSSDGSFTFDALSFNEVGTYYFVITEDNTVDAERVTFDDAVYHVTVTVTDDLRGNLVTNATIAKVGNTEPQDTIGFTNIFTPKPEDITVDINIDKTVLNTGTESITAEGFTFLLDDGVQSSTVLSDAEGKAKFSLTFTEDDIGKTFHYTLSEVNCGKDHVTYSPAVYAMSVAISLDTETNTLVATLTNNEVAVKELNVAFENIYHLEIIEEIPETGNDSKLAVWFTLMFISCGAVVTMLMQDNKNRKANNT